jgi:hypothetical protein
METATMIVFGVLLIAVLHGLTALLFRKGHHG